MIKSLLCKVEAERVRPFLANANEVPKIIRPKPAEKRGLSVRGEKIEVDSVEEVEVEDGEVTEDKDGCSD